VYEPASELPFASDDPRTFRPMTVVGAPPPTPKRNPERNTAPRGVWTNRASLAGSHQKTVSAKSSAGDPATVVLRRNAAPFCRLPLRPAGPRGPDCSGVHTVSTPPCRRQTYQAGTARSTLPGCQGWRASARFMTNVAGRFGFHFARAERSGSSSRFGISTISMRRFCLRPSGSTLDATGCVSA
jgi:hypothetical protein